ncbi:MAG: FAD:protein FMN transferase [Candidatus Omnitrophica bacterium]|nr:FAD:protein FMN transferase [Candidatus Omnitrophota bacterium]
MSPKARKRPTGIPAVRVPPSDSRDFLKRILAVCACILFLSVTACAATSDLLEYKEERPYFGATVTLHCFFSPQIPAGEIVESCWLRLDDIQNTMSVHAENGDLVALNRAGTEPVQVKSSTYELIKRSAVYSQMTGGAFDVTIYPLVEFWKDAEKQGTYPKVAEVNNQKIKVNYTNLGFIKPDEILLTQAGMKVDLGGVAKGYAVDEVARILLKGGIRDFMIDAGGDMYCRGGRGGERGWPIGIQDPTREGGIIGVLDMVDMAVTTSGDYSRYYTINGKRLSHIIDPRTGYPQERATSATVITPSAEEADALSTALCVLGGPEGIALIETIPNAEALIVENHEGTLKTYRSTGFPE